MISPVGKFGVSVSPNQRKASCNRVALPNSKLSRKYVAGSLCVSIIHRTLTWTNMIFNVRSYVIIVMRACVYTRGVGHTDSESTQMGRGGGCEGGGGGVRGQGL